VLKRPHRVLDFKIVLIESKRRKRRMRNHPNRLLNLFIREKIMLTVTLDDDVASILSNMAICTY
jgi:hypothetical protein